MAKPVDKKIADKQKEIKTKKTVKDWDLILRALSAPHVTEKATTQEKFFQYVFRVPTRSTKLIIKEAIKNLYGKEVAKVTTINVKPKPRRRGRKIGHKPGYKKAIITLKRKEKLDVFSQK